jgi:hypothetical protein
MGLPVWTWCLTEGMRRDGAPVEPGTHAPRAALDFIIANPGEAIFHLKDFSRAPDESSEIRRRLRDVYQACLNRRKFVVITSPVRLIPAEIERSVAFLELLPPDAVELVEYLREAVGPGQSAGDESALHQMAAALRGLTLDEAGMRCGGLSWRVTNSGPMRCPRCYRRKSSWSAAAVSSSSSPRARIWAKLAVRKDSRRGFENGVSCSRCAMS